MKPFKAENNCCAVAAGSVNELCSPLVSVHPSLEAGNGCGERSVALSATSVQVAKGRRHSLQQIHLGRSITLSKAKCCFF